MRKIGTLLLVSGLALAGCETIVDVDAPPHTPQLAMLYTLSNQAQTPGSQRYFEARDMFVSSSQGVLDTRLLAGRGDATVELRNEAGQVVEQFRSKPRPGYTYGPNGALDSLYGYYVPVRGFAGEPGKTYTLRAYAPGLEAVEASLTLPARPVVESATYVARQAGQNNGSQYVGRLNISVLDPAATTDYYVAYGRVLDQQGRFWGVMEIDYNSPNNSSDGPELNLERFQLSSPYGFYGQNPFADTNINGQRFSLSTDVVLYYQGIYDPRAPALPTPAFVEVVVSSITPDTFRFFQSLRRYYDTEGNIFAEPAPLFTNLQPGYGVFGGATDVTYRIPL